MFWGIMKTKDRILTAALELFAQKGYDGVGIREIASAVGVRGSALYKHFSSKEEILNAVVQTASDRIRAYYFEKNLPEAHLKENQITAGYKKLSNQKLCQMAWGIFEFFVKDPFVSSFRKLLMREQFQNPEISTIYNNFFVEGAIANFSKLFDRFVKDGFFKKENPRLIALYFYAPIQLLFQKYDCQNGSEDQIKKELFNHVKLFGKCFAIEQKKTSS